METRDTVIFIALGLWFAFVIWFVILRNLRGTGRQIAHEARDLRREARRTQRAWKAIRSGGSIDEVDALQAEEEAREEAGYWQWIESELRREKSPKRTFTRLGLMHSYTALSSGPLLTMVEILIVMTVVVAFTRSPFIFFLLFVLAILVPILIVRYRRTAARQVRTIVRGEHAAGTIVEMRFDTNEIVYVYRFAGRRHRRESPQLGFRYVRNRGRGDAIDVYVDPTHPDEGEADVFGYRARGWRVPLRNIRN